MARFEQFEVWGLAGSAWVLVAAFPSFDITSAVARNRGRGVRLLHVVYDNGRAIEQEILFEIGSPREAP